MDQTIKFDVPDAVEFRQVGDELILLELSKGVYFGLDEIGAFIWQSIIAGRDVGEVSAAICSEYDVGKDAAEADTKALIRQLLEAELLTIRG